MKKTVLPVWVICIVMLSITFTACKKLSQQPSQSQQIVGKWTMKSAVGSYTVQGSNSKDTTNFTAADYFDFKADGSVAIMEGGQAHNGNWAIANNKLVFTNTNYVDFAGGFDINTLTNSKLQLHYTTTTNVSSSDQLLIFSR